MSKEGEFLGHPKGLFILFMVEMWERFSFYGMRALLALFLVAPATGVNPGYGWNADRSLAFYGWYMMLVYLSSIPGGIIADKYIGQKKSVVYGGLLLVIGHLILAIDAQWAFFTGIAFVILGVGGLKANISTMVGSLYGKGDERRDRGFYVFYIGINTGGLTGVLATGYAAVTWGWHYGFGMAGIGMLLGQIALMLGSRYLEGIGEVPEKTNTDGQEITGFVELVSNLFVSKMQLMLTIALSIFSVYLAMTYAGGIEKYAYSFLGVFLSLVFGLMTMIYKDVSGKERDRFTVLLLSYLIIIVFWGAFEQVGGLMNLFTNQKTDRFIEFLNFEVPTPWFQSVGNFFIIIFGTVVAMFWVWWQRKGLESSSIFKMAIGVIIMALGFGFMSLASMEYTATGSSAMYWLVLAYLFHTWGELCASPVALSFITRVAPVKYVSIMMGLFWAATGLGNKVAGLVGQYSQNAGELETFTGILVFCVLFGVLVLALLKPLKRMTHGMDEVEISK